MSDSVSQPEAFRLIFQRAKRQYEEGLVSSFENGLLEGRWEIPEDQWTDFNHFCAAMGQPLSPDNPRFHRSRNVHMTPEENDEYEQRCRLYDASQQEPPGASPTAA